MKTRFFTLFLALFLSVFSVLPAFAASDLPRLVDEADLLSDSEEADLLEELDEISERQQVDIVIATISSLEGASPMEYADDFFDYYGYGFGDERDGILFLISMEERDWAISTSGYGITAITDAGQEYMAEMFIEDLSEGGYAAAFTAFAELCDDFITQAKEGEPYDIDNLPQEPFDVFWNLVFALVAGFIIALIITGIMRLGLKSVCSQSAADDYMKRNSMQVTKKKDLFLYRHVDRRVRPKESSNSGGSSTHTSSSGKKHGGGSGKF